jgi:hypothetical protein
MLSILIPTYNYDCSSLVNELNTLCTRAGIKYEIIVGNDGSIIDLQNLEDLTQSLDNFKFLDFKENRCRSAIRNVLAKEAKYDKLLFIDSDMKIYKDDFIENYIKEDSPVISGGIKVIQDNNPKYLLHKKYEENRSVNIATTSNLLVSKYVFAENNFIENVKKYGYEDIIFSQRVGKKYGIKFICNTLIHNGPIPTETFIKRISEATEVLVELYKNNDYKNDIVESSKLLQTYLKIKNMKWLFLLFFKSTTGFIVKQLHSKKPSLLLMDIYKLGILSELI